MNVDTQINAAWVIPVVPDNIALQDTSILIKDGRIVDILPTSEANQSVQATHVHDCQNHILIPGLINAHTHSAMNLLRGFADDLPLMIWLQEHIWPAEQKWVSRDFVHDGALLACAEMIRGGTTCFADMYFFPESTTRAVEQAGMRSVIGLITIDFPSAYANDANDYIQKGLKLHDQLRGHQLIRTMFAPHGPYTCSDEALTKIATFAEELDIPIHIHLHETDDELEHSKQHYQTRPITRLEQLGLLTPRLIAVHMTQLNEDDIEIFTRSGAHVVHCPESNLKLASGFCPVQKLIDSNINVALGTDGVASNNDLDMFGEMRTAALLAKGVSLDASAGSASTILKMATLNGAKSLGINDIVGSIEKGKMADITALEIDNIESMPLYNPISHVVYSANREHVSDVWVAGRQILRDRSLLTLDINELAELARAWQAKIQS